jgi:hypothetical protein
LVAHAEPTARAPRGLPVRAATDVYVSVVPYAKSRSRASTVRRKPRVRRRSNGDLEREAPAGEVLVDLAGSIVETAPSPHDPGADVTGETGEDGVVSLPFERDPYQARRRRGQQQRTERTVDRPVADVDNARTRGRGSAREAHVGGHRADPLVDGVPGSRGTRIRTPSLAEALR